MLLRAGAAYDLSWRTILVRGTFLVGLFVLGAPGRLVPHACMLHGITIAVWMVLQQCIFSHEYSQDVTLTVEGVAKDRLYG